MKYLCYKAQYFKFCSGFMTTANWFSLSVYIIAWMTDLPHIIYLFILHFFGGGMGVDNRSQFSHSIMWILGLKLRSSNLVASTLPTKSPCRPRPLYFWDRVTCIPDLPWVPWTPPDPLAVTSEDYRTTLPRLVYVVIGAFVYASQAFYQLFHT